MHTTSTLPQTSSTAATADTAVQTHSVWATAIRFTLIVTVLFGLGYPLAITLAAHVLFQHKAEGSLILENGQVVGSELLAQSFTSDQYFHPRPSAAGNGYDATASSGSNLAQSNAKLVQRIQGDIDKLSKGSGGKPVPIDLVTTSGSGLDPDITPDAAYFQAARVAKARGLNVEQIRTLIGRHITGRQFGLLGEPRVNVLLLNLDLDRLSGK